LGQSELLISLKGKRSKKKGRSCQQQVNDGRNPSVVDSPTKQHGWLKQRGKESAVGRVHGACASGGKREGKYILKTE